MSGRRFDRRGGADDDTHPLPERTLRFEYPESMDPAWSPRRPEFAYAANAVSLIMPFAEPYFVKSVRSALPQLDGADRTTAEEYLRQELQHHVQHRRFNQIVTAPLPAASPRIEGWMRRTYGWFSKTRSQRFNLAFAAGSETIAFTLARWTEHHLDELFTGAEPVPSTLFLWHLAEEVEHKSAAFDVYEAIDGSRLRYLVAMVMSFVILAWFTGISALTMMLADHAPAPPGQLVPPAQVGPELRLGRTADPAWCRRCPATTRPTSPIPIWMSSWLTHFDPETGTIPEPSFLHPDAAHPRLSSLGRRPGRGRPRHEGGGDSCSYSGPWFGGDRQVSTVVLGPGGGDRRTARTSGGDVAGAHAELHVVGGGAVLVDVDALELALLRDPQRAG